MRESLARIEWGMTMVFGGSRTLTVLAALSISVLASCDSKPAADTKATKVEVAGIAAPAGTEWTTTVAKTPEGGFRMGNPDAKVKLVEFASLWCPHCGEFSEQAMAILKRDYISKGIMSFERRDFILNPVDMAVTLAARCAPPSTYFRLVDGLYEQQSVWEQAVMGRGEPEMARIGALPQAEAFMAYIDAAGLGSFFASRGLPRGKLAQCVADKTQIDALSVIAKDAVDNHGLTGTPGFLINGDTQKDVYSWAALEPKLKAAVQ